METQSIQTRHTNEPMTEQTRERPLVTPPVDIYETADEILLVADVPGVARDAVSIDLNKDRLTLTARRGHHLPSQSTSRGEPDAFDYYRAFVVPSGLDAERITAELSQGVLRVHLPKSAALKPRRIEVKAG